MALNPEGPVPRSKEIFTSGSTDASPTSTTMREKLIFKNTGKNDSKSTKANESPTSQVDMSTKKSTSNIVGRPPVSIKIKLNQDLLDESRSKRSRLQQKASKVTKAQKASKSQPNTPASSSKSKHTTRLSATLESTLTKKARQLLRRSSKTRFSPSTGRETDVDLLDTLYQTSSSCDSVAAAPSHSPEVGDSGSARHVIAKLLEPEGPTVNHLLPVCDSEALSKVYKEAIEVCETNGSRKSPEPLGLPTRGTSEGTNEQKNEPSPFDFRVFPHLGVDGDEKATDQNLSDVTGGCQDGKTSI